MCGNGGVWGFAVIGGGLGLFPTEQARMQALFPHCFIILVKLFNSELAYSF